MNLDSAEQTLIGAIDIGGTKTAVGIISGDGTVLASRSFPTNTEAGYQACLEQMVGVLQSLAGALNMVGVGVACTGPVDALSGTVGDVEFLPGWSGQHLVTDLEQALEFPVAMENDADAAALAEWFWGAGVGSKSCLYITISTGIGAGLVRDGQLFRGKDGGHPEMGHHIVAGLTDETSAESNPTRTVDPVCYCGQVGCWENLASGSAIERWYGHQLDRDPAITSAAEILAGSDELSRRAIDRLAHYIGIGVANLTTILLPDVVVLGGGVTNSLDQLWPDIEAAVHKACLPFPSSRPLLLPAALGPDVALQGAAAAWLSRTP